MDQEKNQPSRTLGQIEAGLLHEFCLSFFALRAWHQMHCELSLVLRKPLSSFLPEIFLLIERLFQEPEYPLK